MFPPSKVKENNEHKFSLFKTQEMTYVLCGNRGGNIYADMEMEDSKKTSIHRQQIVFYFEFVLSNLLSISVDHINV